MTKLTNNVDEQPVSEFLDANAVFKIPYFQRAYRWGNEEFKEFTADLTSIVDGEADIHFLGALITYQSYAPTGQPAVYEIVDGQQRLATCTIFLAAIAKSLSEIGRTEESANILSSYIYIPKPNVTHPSNLKFYPSKNDRRQFKEIVEDAFSDSKLMDALGNPVIRFLPVAGEPNGDMQKQYARARKFFKQIAATSPDRLIEYQEAIVRGLTVVEIRLVDPTNSSKIFERLNYRGVTVTTGDLVRNEIFSRISDAAPHFIDNIHDNEWEPFFHKFADGKNFENYFFPIGLVDDSNVRKGEVFSKLQKTWRDKKLSPSEIIKNLGCHQDVYLSLTAGIPCPGFPKSVDRALLALFSLGAPSSVYPFGLRLGLEFRAGTVNEETVVEILRATESFLVRRAVVGIEPTGLHAVFKSLWSELATNSNISASGMMTAIKSRKTVSVVTDQEFSQAIKKRNLYGTSIVKYLVQQWEQDLPGDHPSDISEIEHVLPKEYSKHWSSTFSAEDHRLWLDRLANLVAISPPQNRELQNREYDHKRSRYATESMYASPKHLATKYENWGVAELKSRADELAKWAVSRWNA
jgi:hypothetical protein